MRETFWAVDDDCWALVCTPQDVPEYPDRFGLIYVTDRDLFQRVEINGRKLLLFVPINIDQGLKNPQVGYVDLKTRDGDLLYISEWEEKDCWEQLRPLFEKMLSYY